MAKVKVELPVLTFDELEAARAACVNAAEAGKAKAAADKEKDAAMGQVFFKMGFVNLDEVKALSPEELAKAIGQRAGKCFRLEGEAVAEFALQKTSQGKYPKWKQELIALNGPAAAAEIEGETATQYSYSVLLAGLATPGSSSTFVLAAGWRLGKAKAASAK